jgi:predicted Zn-dependent protease
MDKAEKEKSKSWLFGIGGALLGGAAGFGLGKLICAPRDNECLARASVIGAAAGAGGGLLVQKFAFMANSREDEMEADRIGFKTSVQAGYDKDQVGSFYSKLLEMEKKHKQGGVPGFALLADALSTHPPSEERVTQMKQLASATSQPGGGKVTSKDFQLAKEIAHDWVVKNPPQRG